MQPSSFIVPLFSVATETPVFIGTGFFVEARGNVILTALHVVKDRGDEFTFSVVVPSTSVDHLMPWVTCTTLKTYPEIDLAVLTTDKYVPEHKVKLPPTDEVALNELIVCHEFSDTRIKSRGMFQSQAASRIGNVTRMLDYRDILGKAGDDILELSFPALKGASGAPVMTRTGLELYGIVLQNVQHELLPVQIETVVDEKLQSSRRDKVPLTSGVSFACKACAEGFERSVLTTRSPRTRE